MERNRFLFNMWIKNNIIYKFKSYKMLWHILQDKYNENYTTFSFLGNQLIYVMNYFYKYNSQLQNRLYNVKNRSYIICG